MRGKQATPLYRFGQFSMPFSTVVNGRCLPITSMIVKYSFILLGNVESLDAVVLNANIIGNNNQTSGDDDGSRAFFHQIASLYQR